MGSGVEADGSLTRVGARGPVVDPSPICPLLFAPQQVSRPGVDRAQTCCQSADTLWVPPRPGTSAGTCGPAPELPSPSWPTLSSPQQLTPPPVTATHEKSRPAANDAIVPPSGTTPPTISGSPRSMPPPSPSWPMPSAPQQNTPESVTAQLWASPAATAETPLTVATRTGSARGVRVPSPSWP